MRNFPDRWIPRCLAGAALVSAAAVLAILAFLIYAAIPFFWTSDILSSLTTAWRPYETPPTYGIGPMVVGSLALALLATALAFPVSVGISLFTQGIGPRWLCRLVLLVIHGMTAIPTVIYAFVAVLLLAPVLRGTAWLGTGFSLLSAGLTLAVLILPTMVLLMRVRIEQADVQVSLTCAALGMSRMQTLRQVVMPLSRRGLIAGLLLGFCRALGDTLIALMISGNAPQLPTSPTDSVRTLTAQIALVVATDWHSPEYRSVAGAGLLLFVLTTGLTILVQRRFREGEAPAEPVPSEDLPHFQLFAGSGSAGVSLSRRANRMPRTAKWVDRFILCFCWLASLAVLAVVFGLVIYLLYRGGSMLGVGLLFGDVPAVDAILGRQRVFDGIWSALVGTVLLVFGAGLIAVPLGVASGIWLAEYGRGRLGRWFSVFASVLAGVPSIIIGLFGFGLILLLRRTLAPHANTCLLLSMVCLALLVLPYLIRATEAALSALPAAVQLLGPSLGLSRWQSIWHVHLPAARWGIQSGVVLAVGRIAEDTAVILMTGVVASAGIPRRWTDHYEALPFTIYNLAAEHRNAAELDRAFGAALVLLCLSIFLLTLARGLTRLAKRSR